MIGPLNTLYFVGQIILRSGDFYLCIVSHTSGATLTDAPENNPNHWNRIQLFGKTLKQIGGSVDINYSLVSPI